MNNSSRKSHEKKIKDSKSHNLLFDEYIDSIEFLVNKYPVKENKQYEKLVNFSTNKRAPIHGWFEYKQGYSEELVKRLLDESKIKKNHYVFDPFTGVGTTQVVAKKEGYKSVGLDVNPVATFAAKVKTHTYTEVEKDDISTIVSSLKRRYKKTKDVPKYQKLTAIFTPSQLDQILRIKGFWESIPAGSVQDFFRLAYISIIEDCSNRVKDGNGIKIAKNKKIIEDVFTYYKNKCQQMLGDLFDDSFLKEEETLVIQGSLLEDSIYKEISKIKIDSSIFSPPYANCFDYCEVYKMELWLGGFVREYSDFLKYRQLAVRSHVNSKFSHEFKNKNKKVEVTANLVATYNIWNKNIPDMIRGYFDDMTLILERIYSLSTKGALCSIVVANSGYKGIIVPTDLLLAEIGEKIGFRVKEIIHARNIRSSSQQMKELKTKSNLMRESIVILEK